MNRQIDPNGPYMHGYRDAELGLPNKGRFGNPYLTKEQRDEYVNGYRAAKLAERSRL